MIAVLGLLVVPPGQVQGQAGEGDERKVPTVPGERLLPLTERTRSFRILSGDGVGNRVTQKLRPAEESEPGDWVLNFDSLNVLYLRRTEGGAIEMVRMDLPREDRAVVYQPAVRLIPPRLRPRLTEVGTGLARIYYLDTGERRRVGAFRHEIEEVSRARFGVPNGPVAGFLVVLDHEIDVDFGKVRLELEGGYVPGEGLVYRHMRYTKEKLGLFGETLRRTAVLDEPLTDDERAARSAGSGNGGS
jgi:hypothetical protein